MSLEKDVLDVWYLINKKTGKIIYHTFEQIKLMKIDSKQFELRKSKVKIKDSH